MPKSKVRKGRQKSTGTKVTQKLPAHTGPDRLVPKTHRTFKRP